MPSLYFHPAVRQLEDELFLLNGKAKEHRGPEQFVIHGTKFQYMRDKSGERLQGAGPLLRPVEILVRWIESDIEERL